MLAIFASLLLCSLIYGIAFMPFEMLYLQIIHFLDCWLLVGVHESTRRGRTLKE